MGGALWVCVSECGHSPATTCARSENNLGCWSFQFVRDEVSVACVCCKPLGILASASASYRSTEIPCMLPCLALHGLGNLNAGLSTCMASALTTEPSS